jgi:hypothetical protein
MKAKLSVRMTTDCPLPSSDFQLNFLRLDVHTFLRNVNPFAVYRYVNISLHFEGDSYHHQSDDHMILPFRPSSSPSAGIEYFATSSVSDR